jgi:hypothetical protein
MADLILKISCVICKNACREKMSREMKLQRIKGVQTMGYYSHLIEKGITRE